jgi:tetratricopeptide (TPR) repeat protein
MTPKTPPKDRKGGKYYTNPVGVPKSLNINPQKNLFQAVDCLVINAKSLFNQKKYPEVKTLLERAVYEKGVVHADVFYLCGEANRRLGHLLIAEQMLLKCLTFEFHSPFTYSSLGFLYRDLGNASRACALFKRALEQPAGQSALVAFELAKMIA